jgi:DNA polymerase III alpha subunit
MPPSINSSEGDFTIDGARIRTGLASVKHLAQGTLDAVLAARKHGPFTSLADFLDRVGSDREETSALVSSGAFDEIEPGRCRALTEYLAARGKLPPSGALRLGFPEGPQWLPTEAFTPLQLRRMEYATLGFSPLVHPLELFYHSEGEPELQASASPAGARRSVTVRGLAAALRHYRDRGRGLWFVTLDHPRGLHELLVPDGVPHSRFEIGAAYAARGALERRFDAVTVKVTSIDRLAERPA